MENKKKVQQWPRARKAKAPVVGATMGFFTYRVRLQLFVNSEHSHRQTGGQCFLGHRTVFLCLLDRSPWGERNGWFMQSHEQNAGSGYHFGQRGQVHREWNLVADSWGEITPSAAKDVGSLGQRQARNTEVDSVEYRQNGWVPGCQ